MAQMRLEEFTVIHLISLQAYCYWSSHKIAILVDSTCDKTLIDDAFEYWIKIFRHSGQIIKLSGSFETAGTNVVTGS